ncbi:hypothetical protein N7465_003597 [Penicillium sp. CMV-2018d]|nr:hypothetical protein N7465_003597 [Penicillium sp. CMV-2018d]
MATFVTHKIMGTALQTTERYTDLQARGVGAFGVIWISSAHDSKVNRTVAIKKIGNPFDGSARVKRTYREVHLMNHLKHDNLINITDIFISPAEDLYLVMDCCMTDLHELIQSRSKPLDNKFIQFFTYQLLRGLKFIHSAGVIHRDLKPSNILIKENCDLKICDFGLAREQDHQMTGYVSTRYYRAPEIMLTWQRYSYTVDIWSTGCILAEMLLGQVLLPGTDNVHHFKLITEMFGKPPKEIMETVYSDITMQFVNSLPEAEPQSLRATLGDADSEAIDLLEKMLDIDPQKRITAADALPHPYLSTYSDSNDEPECEKQIDWSLLDSEMTTDQWKTKMYFEILNYHTGSYNWEDTDPKAHEGRFEDWMRTEITVVPLPSYIMAADRLSSLLSHLKPGATNGLAAITQKNPDDVVITLAIRTPLTKARKGGFKDTELDYMLYALLKETLAKSQIDPALIEDVCLGNVNEVKAAYMVRAAALAAGIPHTAGASTVNRFCSSGLKAVQDIANQIQLGAIDIGVAMGAELMSAASDRLEQPFNEEVLRNQEAADCMQPMGQTSENIGKDFDIPREQQDRYAAESFRRAEAAQKNGWLDDEITPITVKVKDPKTGEVKQVTLSRDDGIRPGTTFESLSKIRPAFPQFGDKSTGGNSSQVTDGAASVLLMRRSKAIELNQPILAKFCGATVAGVPPRVMGIGPTAAIPKLLSKFQLDKNDIDIYEINEAFASMAVYCVKNLGLDHAKVNPRGGAIAIGHPLGATGARQIATILSEARRTKSKILVTSMCIGTGQGMAGLLVNEQL